MRNKTSSLLAYAILAVYLAILLKLFVFKDFSLSLVPHYRYPRLWNVHNNVVPLRTILLFLTGQPSWGAAARNILGNIIPFLPIGMLLPQILRRMSWKRVLGVGIAFSLCIELLQLALRAGIFDVDDILLNTLGVLLGYWVFWRLRKKKAGKQA